MPQSNKKFFLISFVVAILVVVALISFISSHKKSNLFDGQGNPIAPLVEEDEEGPTPIDAFAYTSLYYTTVGAFPSGTSEGAIGCGDGLVAYKVPVDELNASFRGDLVTFILAKLQDPAVFNSAKADYKAALAGGKDAPKTVEVVSGPKDSSLELYTAMSKSKITVQSLKDAPGSYEVKLRGQLTLGGTCDEPRAVAQIKNTMYSAFSTSSVKVYLNGKLI